MQNRNIATIAAVLLAVLAISSCGDPGATEALKDQAKPAAESTTPTVAVIPAVERSVSSAVQVTGSFVARESSDVAPQAGGRVAETPVDVGAFVQVGQVIARMEDRDAQLRLQQAKASQQQFEASMRQAQSRIGLGAGEQFNPNSVPEVLSAKAAYDSATAQAKLAEADAARYSNLIKTGDVSQSAYDRARTQADTAQAQANASRQQYEATLNSARQNYQGVMTAQAALSGTNAQLAIAEKALEDTIVRAPFAGYVSARPVAVGQFAGNNSKIATLLRITPIRLELQVQELNVPQMKVGATVEANVPGYPNRILNGRVAAINPAIDPSSRTFVVIAEFPNGDIALKPGMFGTARILLPGSSKGIFVPRTAVMADATTNSSKVFFVRDGHARVGVVQLGIQQDGASNGEVQVLSGLAAGAMVATDHLADLYDGQPVNINNPVNTNQKER